MELNKTHWMILDSLANGEEPFEAVDTVVEAVDSQSTSENTLNILFELFQLGLVKFRQAPISAFNQSFAEREVVPNKPIEIVGDLKNDYLAYSKKRRYLQEVTIEGNNPTGVPFGIYVEMTTLGKTEWKRDCYKKYWSTDK